MEPFSAWPEWLVWCLAGAGGVIAITLVVCIIDAAIDLEGY